jgi:hypothetical protein
VSRSTQIPDYVHEGSFTALKARNFLSGLYSNSGPNLVRQRVVAEMLGGLIPVAKIITLLGALVFCGYLASACMEHKIPLAKITGKPNIREAQYARRLK